MMILIFFAILLFIPNSIICNQENNLTVLSDKKTEVGVLNGSIVFKCPILTNESSINVIIWYFDSNKVVIAINATRNDTKKRIRGHIDGSLYIENLQYNDTKIYKCEAFREKKLFEVNITLLINGPPLEFLNFSSALVSDSVIKILWSTKLSSVNNVQSYVIFLCESPMDICKQIILNHTIYEYTFTNLKPFTDYHVKIVATNSVGRNKEMNLKVKTKPGTPLVKPYVELKMIGKRNVTIFMECHNCSLKEHMQGEFKYFVIKYMDKSGPATINVPTNETTSVHTIVGLHPYKNYTLFVSVSNGVKFGENSTISFKTVEDVPNPPESLLGIELISDEIEVAWPAAENSNGQITGYVLKISENGNVPSNEKTINLTNTHRSYRFTGLKIKSIYTIWLASRNNAGMSTFIKIMSRTDRAVPQAPTIQDAKFTPKFVQLSWNNVFLPTESSTIFYEICWTAPTKYEYSERCFATSSTSETNIKCSCKPNSTIHSVNIPINRINLNASEISFLVTVSIDSDLCIQNQPCIRLKATSSPFVKAIDDSMRYQHNPPNAIMIVIITIICFIIVLSGFVCFCLRENKNVKEFFILRRHNNNNYSRPPGEYIEAYSREVSQPKMVPLDKTPHPAIEVKDLIDHIMRYRCDDGAGFQSEFEAIEMTDSARWSITVPNRKDNKPKNRYTNVFPYDHSRVIIQNPVNCKSDYINASFVDGFNRRNAYIATQGPLPETIADFWQMVYEQNSEIIVMITNFDERGRRKCEMYWLPGNIVCYGNISVRQTYEKKMAFYTERRFAIKNFRNRKNGSKERTVYHYQYTDWRDFDVPPSSLPVLLFVKVTTEHWFTSSGPIVVHCSAGVGRTGTYICIESQIRQMEHEHKVNIRGFLEHIRQQRMKLVQTESQYTFIHDALYEYYLCPNHDIQKDIFPDYIFQLKFNDCFGFTKQFQMCTQFEPSTIEYIESKRSYNVSKNRSNILPVESRRINLSCEPGIEGSNYINASAIQGYWDMKEFIITQHPLEETEPDFWKMVWEENCTIIVLLSNDSLPEFWPKDENDIRTYPWSQVNYCNCDDNGDVSKHTFLLSSPREDFNLNCTMHHLKQWPSSTNDVDHLLNLLFAVNSDKVHAPIVVVDDFGGSRAGIFVAMSSLLNHLRNNHVVDVYFVMKMIHMERPHTFTSSHDLKFIYEFLEQIIANYHLYPFFTSSVSDFIPNGQCHQNSTVSTRNNNNVNNGNFVTQYATLNTLKSKSSSSSTTFRRRASSAESEPFCPTSNSPHNRISWNPVDKTRFSLMDWSTSSVMVGNGHYNGGLVTNGNGCGGGGKSVQIIANPITIDELPVAKIVGTTSPYYREGESDSVSINLGDNGVFESATVITSTDV